MHKLLSIIFILNCLATKAQPGKEAWHWYFGQDCMIDFSSGQAVSGVGNLTNLEGVAALSNANTGQLIMYTNGMTVCNSNNHVMFNGINLYANSSTTQAALIVPKPGSTTLFYVISVDENGHNPNKGVSYSIADITYNNGQGKIILANQPLTPPPTCEKVTAVKHCNGIDYWIITHSYKSDAFNAYLVTSAGINTIPIVSHTGSFVKDTTAVYPSETGYLKASPNGRKLVFAEGYDWGGYFELFDFDNTTGMVSNPINISHANRDGFYGASFSPDNSKVYVTAVDSSIICRIYQYDVSNIMPANIIASEYIVVDSITLGVNYSGSFDALQMAPDGKIYVARYMLDTLSVINNPNAIGAGCNFQLKGLSLSHNTTSQFGLPNFIDANYAGINLNIPDVKQCSAFPNSTLNAGPGFVSYQWSTGQTTDSIIINGPGKYWVTVINKDGCAKTDTVNAYLINPVTKDTNACAIYTANATQNAVLTYNWFDNNTNPIRTFTNSGVYWIDVAYIGGCSIRDTFDVTVNPLPVVNLGADTTFCLGNLPLNAFNPTSVYNWSTGQTTPSITATKANSYWVKVTNQYNCVAYDTLVVHPETSLFNFSIPNIVTPNGDNINDYIDFSKYQFSTLQLEIYNRWGLKVFESNDPSCVWKPNSNDNDGTYFTNIQYRIDCGADSQTKKINNFITLVR